MPRLRPDDGVRCRSDDRRPALAGVSRVGGPMNITSLRRAALSAAVSVPTVIATVVIAPAAVRSRGAASPASARNDRRPPLSRPPVVVVDPTWRFQIGAQVDLTAPSQQRYGDLRVFHLKVPVRLQWSGRAQGHARIAGYDLYRHNPVHSGELNKVLSGTRATSYNFEHLDMAHPEAGPIWPRLNPKFKLVATDTARKTTVVDPVVRHQVFSEQEDGKTYHNGRSVFPSLPWGRHAFQRRTGPQYDAGAVLASDRRGSALRFPVRAHRGGQWFALVMTTGPRLGKAEIGSTITSLAWSTPST